MKVLHQNINAESKYLEAEFFEIWVDFRKSSLGQLADYNISLKRETLAYSTLAMLRSALHGCGGPTECPSA
jgi:hypothetical protein